MVEVDAGAFVVGLGETGRDVEGPVVCPRAGRTRTESKIAAVAVKR